MMKHGANFDRVAGNSVIDKVRLKAKATQSIAQFVEPLTEKSARSPKLRIKPA